MYPTISRVTRLRYPRTSLTDTTRNTMPNSAAQLNRILHAIETSSLGANPDKAEKVSDDARGVVLRVPVGEDQNIRVRRDPSGVWEILQEPTPPNPLDYFAASGTREALIAFLRQANAAVQIEFPTDDIYRISKLVFQAYEDLQRQSSPVTAVAVVHRYRQLRARPV